MEEGGQTCRAWKLLKSHVLHCVEKNERGEGGCASEEGESCRWWEQTESNLEETGWMFLLSSLPENILAIVHVWKREIGAEGRRDGESASWYRRVASRLAA